MRTPAGKECPHYYQDFHRGRELQECRLIKANPDSLYWQPGDCSKCVVPEMLHANSSRDMELKVTVVPKFLGFGREVQIKANCIKHRQPIEDPFVGCPKCNAERPGLDIFRQALEDDNEVK
jgi:hypothetical protein